MKEIYNDENLKVTDKTGDENAVSHIVVHRKDGSIETVTSGVFLVYEPDEKNINIKLNFINIKGEDVRDIIYALGMMAIQSGVFD